MAGSILLIAGAGGSSRHSRLVPGQPRRVRGDGADLRRDFAAGVADGDLCRVLASLFFYLKRTSQPRVQQWRGG
jgi:hypothetical protein